MKGTMDAFLQPQVDSKFKDIFRWLQWIIKGKHPFTFVDDKYNRKYTKLDPICRTTLMKYMHGVYDRVLKMLAIRLPDSFGGVLDGWTCAREHHIAFFATWTTNEGNVETRLLCCGVQDLPDEDMGETADSFGLTAADVGDYILNSALLKYNKSFENLEFLAGDNCSVNKLLVEGITELYRINKNINRVLPLVGCASHID